MSIIIGSGMCITYMETDVICPICTFEFNCGEKATKSKYPIFKMKCPACKSLLEISMPIFGGTTKCYEYNPPKTIAYNQLNIETPNKINGKLVEKKLFDDSDSDEHAPSIV